MPEGDFQFIPHQDILRYEEIAAVVEALVPLGISKLRLTGGEPLVRPGLVDLVELLRSIKGIEEISLTTNGVLLAAQAEQLKAAGLDRVNVSLDSLDPVTYEKITLKDSFKDTWLGIMRALETGLMPVKINSLIFRGINDSEILDLARLTLRYELSVRFIEFFRTNSDISGLSSRSVQNPEIKARIEAEYGPLGPARHDKGNGPARNFQLDGALGSIGFINAETEPYCASCNRLRLSSDGKVYPCLFSQYNLDVRQLLRGDQTDALSSELERLINEKHNYKRDFSSQTEFAMCSIGG